MNLKKLRQTLKALADDSRLRITNLLLHNELTVKDICAILAANQSAISKHLVRLRLLGIAKDRRFGNFIYYSLNCDSEQGRLITSFIAKFKNLDTFKKDLEKIDKLKR